jgi:membrane protein involved in colicin uptake
MPDTATIGHNSAAIGEMITEDPAIIFRDEETLAQLIEEIEEKIAGRDVNLESNAGRTEIRSFAYQIAQLKSAIDKAGADLNTDHNAAIKRVNTIRKTARERLDLLKDKARAPLTEWEQAEERRKVQVDDFFNMLNNVPNGTVSACEEYLKWLDSLQVDEELLLDRTAEAQNTINSRRTQVQQALEEARQAEADRAELEKLRQEKAAREEEERKAAAAKAAAEAEERRKAEEAERIKAAEERARREAEEKARAEAAAAEAERKAAEERKIAEANKAKEDAERRLREKEEAEAKAKAEEAARAADRANRAKVMNAASEAIARIGMVSDAAASDIVTAIIAGEVPNVSLKF